MSRKLRHHAVLLLGPTGSGKTPLGDLLERRGLRGRRCLHFDFGAQLRRIAERKEPGAFVTRADVNFLKHVLRSGALLEDEHFPIARGVVRAFLAERSAVAETLVVLNGLPRHVGQAEAMDALLDVRMVVYLSCSAETVLARIQGNVGGDRTGRLDDAAESIRRKLALFAERTSPLMDYYRRRQVEIETIQVADGTTAEQMWEILSRWGDRKS